MGRRLTIRNRSETARPPAVQTASVNSPSGSVIRQASAAAQPSIGRTLKIIKVGVLKSHDSYLKAFEVAGVLVSDQAMSNFNQVPLLQRETELELVEVSVEELGFTELTRYDVICKRASERGLDLCPAEAALALRLAHLRQPWGEWLTVAMDAIVDSVGYPHVLDVGHGGSGRCLHTRFGNPAHELHPAERLVFVQRFAL